MGHKTFGKRKVCDFCSWNWESIFHHGYCCSPTMCRKHNPSARLLENLTYHEMTSKDLSVMDVTAITLCQENNIPVGHIIVMSSIKHLKETHCTKLLHLSFVFNLSKPGNIAKAIKGERVGTLIGGTCNSRDMQLNSHKDMMIPAICLLAFEASLLICK
ncbi:hypothetical protein Peur_029046 [Populus x canadensis]